MVVCTGDSTIVISSGRIDIRELGSINDFNVDGKMENMICS